MNWNDLRFALALQQSSTVKVAAKTLSVDRTTFARRIKALEQQFDDVLFTSVGQKWVPTEKGQRLAELASSFQAHEAQTLERINNKNHKYRISGPEFILNDFLAPSMSSLLGNQATVYPDLIVGEGFSLAYREVDLSLSFSPPQKGRIVSSRILSIKYGLFQRVGDPPSGWVGLEDTLESAWEACENLFETKPSYRTTSLDAAKAIGATTGLAFVAPLASMAKSSGFKINQNFPIVEQSLWCSYHEERRFETTLQSLKEQIKSVLRAMNECSHSDELSSGSKGIHMNRIPADAYKPLRLKTPY